jgi:hypothetical protein
VFGFVLANGAGANSKARISSDDIKFADFSPKEKEKYLIALGVYRIIHCISFVCLASHRGNYLMFR